MKPRVVIYNYVSVDGRVVDGFEIDLDLFYSLATVYKEDATLTGADTLNASMPENPETIEIVDNQGAVKPLLVVTDSKGRLKNCSFWKNLQYWRDVLILCSKTTSASYINSLKENDINYMIIGQDRIDLAAALQFLNESFGIKTVRVDSGGSLNGALLDQGLVDEVSVLIAPCLVGGANPNTLFKVPLDALKIDTVNLKLIKFEKLDGDFIWLRYDVVKK